MRRGPLSARLPPKPLEVTVDRAVDLPAQVRCAAQLARNQSATVAVPAAAGVVLGQSA